MSEKNALMPSWGHVSEYADIVIVGNGIAGLTAAIEARRFAPDSSIVIMSEQCYPTINTPALKQFAAEKLTQEQLLAYPPGTERSLHIQTINARVEGINAQGKYVYLQGGRRFGYGSLLIATGSRANGLPADLPGRRFDGVLTLHTLNDYLDLRRRLPEVDAAVVIGGGAHAIETVMVLRQHGLEVHWLIRGDIFLPKMLDRTASEIVLAHIRRMGVKVYTRTEVIGIVGRVGSVIGVVTNQQRMIPCQLVVACTGTSPVMTLAERCTLPMLHKQGIFVDEQFRTNVPWVYAAGDVAAHKNPYTGAYEAHPFWYAAVEKARIAAASMTGHFDPAIHTLGVSWHATHLGELCMLNVGVPLASVKGVTVFTDSSKRRYSRMAVVGDRLIGYLSLGQAQPDSLAIKQIIDRGISIRNIKNALLKGSFDARKYIAEHQSETIRHVVTSGKLPAVIPAARQALPAPSLPRIPVVQHSTPQRFQWQPQRESEPDTPPSIPIQVQSGRVLEPRTGPLQEQSRFVLRTCDQPTIHDDTFARQPSTGELEVSPDKVVESILVPLPARSISRSLWSYSQKLPAVQSGTVRKPSEPAKSSRSNSRNLWSYSQKLPAITTRATTHTEKARSSQPEEEKPANEPNFLL